MTGYTPAEQAIREQRGLPRATGADEPPAWHGHCPRCPLCSEHRHGGPCGRTGEPEGGPRS